MEDYQVTDISLSVVQKNSRFGWGENVALPIPEQVSLHTMDLTGSVAKVLLGKQYLIGSSRPGFSSGHKSWVLFLNDPHFNVYYIDPDPDHSSAQSLLDPEKYAKFRTWLDEPDIALTTNIAPYQPEEDNRPLYALQSEETLGIFTISPPEKILFTKFVPLPSILEQEGPYIPPYNIFHDEEE